MVYCVTYRGQPPPVGCFMSPLTSSFYTTIINLFYLHYHNRPHSMVFYQRIYIIFFFLTTISWRVILVMAQFLKNLRLYIPSFFPGLRLYFTAFFTTFSRAHKPSPPNGYHNSRGVVGVASHDAFLYDPLNTINIIHPRNLHGDSISSCLYGAKPVAKYLLGDRDFSGDEWGLMIAV